MAHELHMLSGVFLDMPVDRDDDLLPKQAAAEIGMSVQWLYKRIKEGSGPPHRRRGRIILISKDALKIWDSQPVIP